MSIGHLMIQQKFQGDEVEKLEFTRKVRDQIDQRIQQWLKSQNIEPSSN